MFNNKKRLLKKAIRVWQEEGFDSFVTKTKHKMINKLSCQLQGNHSFIIGKQEKCDSELFFIDVMPDNNPMIKSLRVKDEFDYSIEVPFSFQTSITTTKVAAIIHIFYPEISEEILTYLNHIPCDVDVFISTDTQDKKDQIQEKFSEFSKGKVEIRLFQNQGRDIAPTLIGFKDVYCQYEIFVHLHSKKSLHAGDGLFDWRHYTYETLLGSMDTVSSILHLLENDTIGMVFPQHFRPLRACINWGYDYEMTERILTCMGIKIDSEALLEFPSGSMFWAKSEAIKPLLDLQLTFEDFPLETGQVDGTLAHAIERAFLYVVEAQGFRWLKIASKAVCVDKDTILSYQEPQQLQKLVEKVYRPLFNRYVWSRNKLDIICPELKYYKCFPEDDNKKPRLNLLVPTINPSQVYGGVATALKLFNELRIVLGTSFDYRIIVENAIIDDDARLLYKDSYILIDLAEQISIITDKPTIVDGNNFKRGYLHIREDDIFIATAWWTALTGFDLIKHQERFFQTSKKLVYLIQDYESNFNQWSSRWAMAEETYQYADKIIAIINSEELTTFMLERYSFDTVVYIPYTINEKLKQCLQPTVKHKQIIFYGRPNVQRNAFEIIVDGISLWQKKYPIQSKEWKIISAGEQYPQEFSSNVKNIEILGKVSLEQYANLLNESALGISLMISPHPSYPPLEMAFFGVQTITNKYDHKDIALRSDNIISLQSYHPEKLAECIQQTIEKVEAQEYRSNNIGLIKDLPTTVEKYNANKLGEIIVASLNACK